MNSLTATIAIEHSSEVRPRIREMLQMRTRELALRAGRIPPHVSQLDYEQAKRELTGESDLCRQDAVIASIEAADTRGDHTRAPKAEWTEMELDESILRQCDEFPEVRMEACSLALEHCRRSIPRSTPDSLLIAMRDTLRLDVKSHRGVALAAA